jgi:hypothetical protein
MMGVDLVTAAISPYVTALIGIAGTAIGGAIAGGISLRLAKEGREAAADA